MSGAPAWPATSYCNSRAFDEHAVGVARQSLVAAVPRAKSSRLRRDDEARRFIGMPLAASVKSSRPHTCAAVVYHMPRSDPAAALLRHFYSASVQPDLTVVVGQRCIPCCARRHFKPICQNRETSNEYKCIHLVIDEVPGAAARALPLDRYACAEVA